jgi:hypothetical protein
VWATNGVGSSYQTDRVRVPTVVSLPPVGSRPPTFAFAHDIPHHTSHQDWVATIQTLVQSTMSPSSRHEVCRQRNATQSKATQRNIGHTRRLLSAANFPQTHCSNYVLRLLDRLKIGEQSGGEREIVGFLFNRVNLSCPLLWHFCFGRHRDHPRPLRDRTDRAR